jgi:hypothetical protein
MPTATMELPGTFDGFPDRKCDRCRRRPESKPPYLILYGDECDNPHYRFLCKECSSEFREWLTRWGR